MGETLKKQLHEQYAINNNANLSSIITLVVSLIAVLGYFGYIYAHTGSEFSECLDILYCAQKELYTMDVLCLTYIASITVLYILFRICLYQGVAQRCEQFIIYAIRKEASIHEDPIFSSGYNPFSKKGLQIVQGLYGELIKIFIMVFVIITAFIIVKTFIFFCVNSCSNIKCLACVELISTLFIIFIYIICSIINYNKQVYKYFLTQNEYLIKINKPEQPTEQPTESTKK